MKNQHFNCFILFVLLILAAGITGCRSSAKLEMSPLNLSSPTTVSGQPIDVESTITNSGGTEGKLAATLKIDGEAVETKEMTVGTKESKKITFHYTAGAPGKHKVEINGIEATLEVLRPAEFQLSALNISPSEILPKQTITVNADINNLGDLEDTYIAKLRVDGGTLATKDILVKPGATEKVAFTCAIDSPGIHTVLLGDLSKTVTVLKPAEFTVTDMSLDTLEIAVGKSATVTGKVSNNGEVTGTYTAVLKIDGKDVESKDVIVRPGTTEVVSFSLSNSTAGSYQIALGSQAKTLSVFETRPFLLQHDNRVISDSWSIYEPRGQWVKFSPPSKPFVIQEVFIGGKRTDFSQPEKKNYTLKIWNKDFTQVLYSADYPYSKFSTSFSMAEHEIKPGLNIEGDFCVEIISHSESPPAGEQHPNIALYIECDYTVAGNEDSGYSWLGTIDNQYLADQIKRQPKFSAFSWIMQVRGIGRAPLSTTAASPEKVVIDPVTQTLADFSLRAMSKAGQYKFDFNMQMPIEIVGGKEAGKGSVIYTVKGYLNNIEKEMKSTMNMTMNFPGTTKENITDVIYITKGWMYVESTLPDGNEHWDIAKLTDELWNSQSKVFFLDTGYVKSASSVELTGNETIDGIVCQVLKIKPATNILPGSLNLQQSMSSIMGSTKTDFSRLVKEYSIQEWIANDTFLLAKEELRFYLEASPADTGDNILDFDKMSMSMHVVSKLYDYNIPVTISLPPAALKAREALYGK